MTEAPAAPLPNVLLLNDKGEFEPASNPLNKYSTIRKGLNMQGIGPSYGFARTMTAHTDRQIGLVVNARGGSSILSWRKGDKDGYYEEALKRVRTAIAKGGVLKAVLWHQGEADVPRMDTYRKHFTELVTNLRHDLGMPELLFIAGEIATWGPTEQAARQNVEFNNRLRETCECLSNVVCVSSEGLQPLINPSDPHFCTASQLQLGERYAEAVLAHYDNNSHEGLRVLFIGDSITDGNWGASNSGKPSFQRNHWDMNHIYGSGYMYLCASYYQGKYPKKRYRFFNRGISGNTLINLEQRWEEDAIQVAPDVLSILIGTNDIHHYLRSGSPEPFDFAEWERKYRSLLDRSLAANPQLKIVLAAPFVANVGSMRRTNNFSQRKEMVEHCAEIVRQIAADYHAVFLPYNVLFDQLQKKTPADQETYWIWDGVHPTPAGHRRMADMWIKKVKLK